MLALPKEVPIDVGDKVLAASACVRQGTKPQRRGCHRAAYGARGPRLLQGFGNVGAWAAEILADMGGKVLAASDAWGAVGNSEGLDVKELRRHLAAGGRLADFPGGVATISQVVYWHAASGALCTCRVG